MALARDSEDIRSRETLRYRVHFSRRQQEMAECHSISRSIRYPRYQGLPHHSYEPPELPPSYDAETTGYLELARFIPPDGRIQLPFDFHWQIQQDQFECEIEQQQLECQNETANLEDRLRNKAKSKVQSLNAFLNPCVMY